MTRKERLMATIKGESVDRAPVCFYELNGIDENPNDNDPYNIFSHPSWLPLIELTREKTDRIVMRGPRFIRSEPSELDELTTKTVRIGSDGTRYTDIEIRAGSRILRQKFQQTPDVNTVWATEHLLKDEDDLAAWIELPNNDLGVPDYGHFIEAEEKLGDGGILMIDTHDALCGIASLFSMEDYTVMALTEQKLFHRAMEKVQQRLLEEVEITAKNYPGRLWRIFGPEYAVPPYLPPKLYEEYVVKYDKSIVDIIHKYGGYARIHSHGNMKDTLSMTVKTGCMGIDPIEPPPQGDVTLAYVREHYGEQLVLFGNLEVNDIEMLEPDIFERRVITALEEGTAGKGRGFVLMPSACPYGRELSAVALENYRRMIEVHDKFFK